jgi:hypothetical protein
VRERRQAEIDPVLCRQALGHYAAPYSTVLTVAMGVSVVSPYTTAWRRKCET